MEEEEDDFYTQNGDAPVKNEQPGDRDEPMNQPDDDVQDDEDDDDDDDSDDDSIDINIITERKEGPAQDPPWVCSLLSVLNPSSDGIFSQPRPNRAIKPELPRTASIGAAATPTQQAQSTPTIKTEPSAQSNKKVVSLKDGSKYPEIRTSSIDVNATPTWDPAGKLITEVDIDAGMLDLITRLFG